jgi:hypothetical protein
MKIYNDEGVALDADASVEVTGSFATVTFESRGPGRNIEYIPAFELVFRRLAKVKATLHDALVVSRETKLLQESERRAKPGLDYPIALADGAQAVELAASIRSAAARIGQAPDVKGGGNPTKRIAIQVTIPDPGAQPSGWLQHCLLFPTELAPTEVIETTVRSGAKGGRQGYGLDAAGRKVIEDHAMARAASYFTALGATVEDVSRTECYDLKCIDADGHEFHVEVKGTTGLGETILLTRNEVAHAEKMHPGIALFVVSQIELRRTNGTPVANGGGDRLIYPWKLDRSKLEALAFSLELE